MKTTVLLFCVLSVAAVCFQAIDACCNFDNNCGGRCCGGDRTIRQCNFVCCDCVGGCSGEGGWWANGQRATGRRLRRHDRRDSERASETFDRIDKNGDGTLSFDEAFVEMNSTGLYKEYLRGRIDAAWFEEMDKNGNGRIEPGELDWHLL